MKFTTHISEFEPPIPNPQPFIDKAFAMYEKIIADKRGKVVFVVGEIGRGKTEIMGSLVESFKQINPTCNVVDGCFIDGKYKPYIPKLNVDFTKTIDTIGNIGSALAKFVSPRFAAFLDLGGQLLQTGAANIDFVKSHTANPPQMPETPYWLLQILRETVKQKPLVCVIDDFDEAQERFGWNSFLLSLAEEVIVDLPILFAVSMTGKAEVGEHKVGEDNLEYVTRELVGRGLAEWWYLKPMTPDEIAEWIPLETSLGIVSQLHGITGGNPRWVQTLWHEWRVNENVVFNEYHQIWEWSKDKKPELNQLKGSFENLLKTLLQTDELQQITEAKKILGLAALEGNVFTAESLALALGKDTDELIDYLDDNFVLEDSRPNGILLENGFVEIEIESNIKKTLWRYKFASDWHWQILDRYAFPTDEEKYKYASEMIQALQIVFETNERFVAKSLVRLFNIIKDNESAHQYQQIADHAMRFEVMHEYALALLKVDTTNLDRFRCQQLGVFLLKVGEAILGANPYEDLAIFEKTEEFAKRGFDTETLAIALYYIGWIQIEFGHVEIAKEKAEIGIKLVEKTNDKLLQGKYYALLGKIAKTQGRYKEAEPFYKKSTEISEKVLGKDHYNTAISYDNLGLLYHELEKFEEAEPLHKKALRIFERVLGENHYETATTYSNLAHLYDLQGRYEEAETLCRQSLEIRKRVLDENHPSIALSYDNLASIYCSQGKYGEANLLRRKALGIFETVLGENHLETAICYQNLGVLNMKQKKIEEAKEYFEKALAVRQNILGNNHPDTINSWQSLEEIKILEEFKRMLDNK